MTGHRLEVADVFHAHENKFLQRWDHAVSDQQRKVLRDIGRCRTAALGTHLERCDRCSYGLRKRQESISEEVKEIAWKAQHRLHKRYMRLAAAGKDKRKITTAVARELLGFIWAIGIRAETVARQRVAA